MSRSKHFDSILPLHGGNGFKVSNNETHSNRYKQITIPFSGGKYDSVAGHVQMGLFYELVTTGLFGGRLWQSAVKQTKFWKGWIQPDVITPNGRTLWESKALRTGHQMNLLDEQINKYKTYQILYPESIIYYAFYRHTFKGIKKMSCTYTELMGYLAGNTLAGIMLPFSLVLRMFSHKRFKRYENGPWHDCTQINSTFLNQFIFDPDTAIRELEWEPKRFVYERHTTPNDFVVEDKWVHPFPFIQIRDKGYNNWAKKLSNEIPF